MKKHNKRKHILLLGGMGPQASVYAHSLILETAVKNGAKRNEDYPRITHLSINVEDFINSPKSKQAALKYILECLAEVDLSTVDDAFIACNTAHILLDDIEKVTGLKFTSLVKLVNERIIADKSIKSVGILATPSTLMTGLYDKGLLGAANVIKPEASSSRKLEEIIRDVIGGGDQLSLSRKLGMEIDKLVNEGAQRIVLGCTELSLLSTYLDKKVVIDPLQLTIEQIIYENNA